MKYSADSSYIKSNIEKIVSTIENRCNKKFNIEQLNFGATTSELDFSGDKTNLSKIIMEIDNNNINSNRTAIIISDGISDVFEAPSKDEDMNYSGFGLEFYMEFEGSIPFDEFNGHYSLDFLSQITQTAIGHGSIKNVYEENGILSVQLNKNAALPEAYTSEELGCGILIGVPSHNIQVDMKLPVENCYLLSLKLISIEQLQNVLNADKPDVKRNE